MRSEPSKKLVKDAVLALFRLANRDPSGLLAAAMVLVVGTFVSWIGWFPLGLPARLVGTFVSPGSCSSVRPGTLEMYLCSATVAGRTLVGPIAAPTIVIVLLFLLRNQMLTKLPVEARFLVAPVVATILFALSWAAIHYQSTDDSGLLSQKIFPAVIGFFTFVSARYGPAFQRVLVPFFKVRDKVPSFLRIMIVFLIPLVVALVITFQERVSDTAQKEQIVVLLSLCTGYLALAPRQGDLLSEVRRIVTRKKGNA